MSLITLLDQLQLLGMCFSYIDFEESLKIIKELPIIEKVLKYMTVKSYNTCLHLDTIQLITKYNKKQILIRCFESITDTDLKYLCGVQAIDLSYCDLITDNGLKYLSGIAIHTIDLSWCKQITDNGLKYLSGIYIQ
jgi:hypothetical protein